MRSECGNCRRLCAGVLIAAAVLGAHFPRGGVTAAGAGGGRSGGVNGGFSEVSGSWLTAGEQYVYSYTSSAAIHSNIELVVETKVSRSSSTTNTILYILCIVNLAKGITCVYK